MRILPSSSDRTAGGPGPWAAQEYSETEDHRADPALAAAVECRGPTAQLCGAAAAAPGDAE